MKGSALNLAPSLAAALLLIASIAVRGAELHVAVAANFSGPLQQLAPMFERASGHHLLVSSGSSGQLYAQIRQGAPFDVFLSADVEKPALLEQQSLTVPGSRFVYAIGTLVLWSATPGFIDSDGHILLTDRYRLLGIANPQTAPYGGAAQQVLTKLGLWERLNQQHRIVQGENITQAWQFAATGNADLAFVALSQVLGPDGRISGSSWIVPQAMYEQLDQAAVVLAASREQDAAQSFAHWLHFDPGALAAIRAAGYRTAD